MLTNNCWAQNDKYSFLHVVKPEIDLPEETDIYDEKVYEKAKENLYKMIEEKILVQDEKPHLYIYRQIWKGHEQYGIVGTASADEYNNDTIKKHEFTRKKKEDEVSEDKEDNIISNIGTVYV